MNPDRLQALDRRLRPFLAHPLWGLLVVLAVLLPLRLHRASLESSIWMDEAFTLVLVNFEVPDLVQKTADDAHPPLYYLGLKTWLKLGRMAGMDPGILWARLPSVLGWAALVSLAWFAGRDLLGRRAAWVACACTGLCGILGEMGRDARPYALAVPACFLCFWMIVRAGELARAGGRVRCELLAWLVYIAAAATALWSHLLSGVMLAVLALVWLAVWWWRARSVRYLAVGFVAQAIALATFTPWLRVLSRQFSVRESYDLEWVTSPNVYEYLTAFWYWIPNGPLWEVYTGNGRSTFYALGFLAFLMPCLFWISARLDKRPLAADATPELARGLFAGVASLLFVLALLVADLVADLAMFFTPRYPVFAAPLYVFGLVGITTWALKRHGWNRHWLWVAAVPMVLAGLSAHGAHLLSDARGSLERAANLHPALFPKEGGDLYVMPPEFIPYRAGELARYNPLRIEEMQNLADDAGDITIVDFNTWWDIDRPRDVIAQALITQKRFAKEAPSVAIPDPKYADYVVYRLQGVDGAKAREILARGFEPAPRDIPEDAVALALPEIQRLGDGWHVLEVTEQMDIFRWAGGNETIPMVFRGGLEPGDYILHFVGYRNQFPEPVVDMKFQLAGEEAVFTLERGEGGFRAEIPFTATRAHKRPVFLVTHPIWQPIQFEKGSKDDRKITFFFNFAYITRAAK